MNVGRSQNRGKISRFLVTKDKVRPRRTSRINQRKVTPNSRINEVKVKSIWNSKINLRLNEVNIELKNKQHVNEGKNKLNMN